MNGKVTGDADSPPYVLALTIVRTTNSDSVHGGDKEEVLFCVRNRDVNLTHPNVVSVPTQRIPTALGDEMIAEGLANGTFGKTQLLNSKKSSNRDTKGHNSMIYAVESLLAGKMGMADHLESNEFEFTVELAGFHHGHAQYEKGTGENPDVDDDEELRMINLVVRIDEGIDSFPPSTISYDYLLWTSTPNFRKMWENNDTTLIGLPDHVDIWVCAHGLCIASTYDILSAKLT